MVTTMCQEDIRELETLKDKDFNLKGYKNVRWSQITNEPISFECPMKYSWQVYAMKEEFYSTEKSQTWELVGLPTKNKAISVKWVYI